MPDEVALVAGLPHKRTALVLGMLVPEQFGDRLFLKLGLIGALVLEFELMFGGCLAIGGVRLGLNHEGFVLLLVRGTSEKGVVLF